MARNRPSKSQKKTKRKKKVVPGIEDVFGRQQRFWLRHWKEALILLVIAVALYVRALPYEFVLDDQLVITDNNFTKSGISGIPDIFSYDSFTGYFGEQKDLVFGSRYRPLSIALFAVIYEFFGDDTRPYHLLNILLYALLGLLIFRVLAVLFHRSDHSWHWLLTVPFLGALFYVLHPVHTEAVANIKGCDEILAMLGAMGALYGALRYVYRGSRVWLILSGVAFAAGLFAKENAITFLAVIPLTLYFFTPARPLKWVMATLPALIATVAYLFVRYQVIGFLMSENVSTDVMNNPFVEMGQDQKYATIVYTLGLYAKLLFIPHPLTHDYYPYHIPIMEWIRPEVLVSAAVYLALMFFGLRGLWKRRVYAYCILFFLATLSIVSNVFFPIGTFMNERFLFMPSLAFCILAGYYGSHWLGTAAMKYRWPLLGVMCLYLAGFAWKTWTRVPVWESPLSLNTAGVRISPKSARSNTFMGVALFQEAQRASAYEEKMENLQQAEFYFNRSLAILPYYLNANKMKSGVAAEYYRFDRDLDKLLNSFAEILGRRPDVDYIAEYCEYLNGRDIDIHKLIAFYHHVGYHIIAERTRRYDFALKYLNYGLQLNPNHGGLHLAVGRVYALMGNQERSTHHIRTAHALDPSLAGQ